MYVKGNLMVWVNEHNINNTADHSGAYDIDIFFPLPLLWVLFALDYGNSKK